MRNENLNKELTIQPKKSLFGAISLMCLLSTGCSQTHCSTENCQPMSALDLSNVNQRYVNFTHHNDFNSTYRKGRGVGFPLFSLGKVLNFFPVGGERECRAEGPIKRSGICLNPYDCHQRGGTASGDCAHGFGVCCTFTVTCGGQITNNLTYIFSPDFPEFWDGTDDCNISITKMHQGISQLRLDFIHFNIGQPNRSTGACDGDLFELFGENRNYSYFKLCGQNHGQHIYYDVDGGPNSVWHLRVRAKTKVAKADNIKNINKTNAIQIKKVPNKIKVAGINNKKPQQKKQNVSEIKNKTQLKGQTNKIANNKVTKNKFANDELTWNNKNRNRPMNKNNNINRKKNRDDNNAFLPYDKSNENRLNVLNVNKKKKSDVAVNKRPSFVKNQPLPVKKNAAAKKQKPVINKNPAKKQTITPIPIKRLVPARRKPVPFNRNRNNNLKKVYRQSRRQPRAVVARLFQIRIIQLPLAQRAPPGCLQYFNSWAGTFQTMNFAENGRHLSDQDYRVCVRRAPNACAVAYEPCDVSSFRIGPRSDRRRPAGIQSYLGPGGAGGAGTGFYGPQGSFVPELLTGIEIPEEVEPNPDIGDPAIADDIVNEEDEIAGSGDGPDIGQSRQFTRWSPWAQQYAALPSTDAVRQKLPFWGYGNFGHGLYGYGRQRCDDRITAPCDNDEFITGGVYGAGVCDPHHCGSTFCPGNEPGNQCRVESSVTPFQVSVHFGPPTPKANPEDNIGACLRYEQVACS